MSIPTVSDTASIQTPLGIVTYGVLFSGFFSSPKSELDHTWCRTSRDTERHHDSSSRPSCGNEAQATNDGNRDGFSSLHAISASGDDIGRHDDSGCEPSCGNGAHATDNENRDGLSSLHAISDSEIKPPEKLHNLRAFGRSNITTLFTGRNLPSPLRKRTGDVNGTHNGDPFDNASRIENAHESLEQEQEQEGPETLTVPKRCQRKKYRGLRHRTPVPGPRAP